jgi:hypothetical protein
MRSVRWLVCIGVIAAWLLASAGQGAGLPKDKALAKAVAEAKQLVSDLREARGALANTADKKLRDRLELILVRAELRVTELQKQLTALQGPNPVTPEELAQLLKGLQGESFDNGKTAFVSNFARDRYFTCKQAAELLKTFSFDDGRSKAAQALYPRLIDPNNFFEVLNVFTFNTSRESLRKALKLK